MTESEFYSDSTLIEKLLEKKTPKLNIVLNLYMQNINNKEADKNLLKEYLFNHEYLCIFEELMNFFSEEKKEERFIRASLKSKNGMTNLDIARNVFFLNNKDLQDVIEERLEELYYELNKSLTPFNQLKISNQLQINKHVLKKRVEQIFLKQKELQKEFEKWVEKSSSLKKYEFSEKNITNHFDKVIAKLLNQDGSKNNTELDISILNKFSKDKNSQKTIRLNYSLYEEWLKTMLTVPGLEKETQTNLFNISMTWAIKHIKEFEKNKTRQDALDITDIKKSPLQAKPKI